jgi:hypothetical protein
MQTRKTLHPLPSPAATATLTALADHRQPQPRNFIDESAEALTVARNRQWKKGDNLAYDQSRFVFMICRDNNHGARDDQN